MDLSPNTGSEEQIQAAEQTPEQTTEVVTPEVTAEAPAEVVEPQQPDFIPDLSFTVHDKKKQMDERFKELVKSKEHEDLLRDLYTKADGIDEVKTKRDEYRNKFQELQNTVNQTLSAAQRGELGQVMQALGVNTRDISGVLSGLGYQKDDIIRYAYQLAQLTPEQENIQNQMRQAELDRQQLQQQNSMLQTQFAQVQVQNRRSELQSALSRPEIAPLVEAFDKAYGDGAFFEEVANRGALHYQRTQQDLPVAEAIAQAARLAKPLIQQSQPQQQPQGQLPVIPSVGGGGSKAVVGKRPMSVDALRELARSYKD